MKYEQVEVEFPATEVRVLGVPLFRQKTEPGTVVVLPLEHNLNVFKRSSGTKKILVEANPDGSPRVTAQEFPLHPGPEIPTYYLTRDEYSGYGEGAFSRRTVGPVVVFQQGLEDKRPGILNKVVNS